MVYCIQYAIVLLNATKQLSYKNEGNKCPGNLHETIMLNFKASFEFILSIRKMFINKSF